MRERIAVLVHPDVRADGHDRARHERFIAGRLATVLGFVVLVVPGLAWLGTPSLAQAFAFACAMLPLAAVVLVSRTGRLEDAQVVASAGLIGAAAFLALGGDALLVAPLAWLLVAIVDAAASQSRRAVRSAVALSGGALAAIAAQVWLNGIGTPSGEAALLDLGLLALAGLHIAVLAAGFLADAQRTDAALRDSAAQVAALVELGGDLVCVHDSTGAVVTAENGAARVFAANARDFGGRGLFERIHVGDRPAFLKAIADAFETEHVASATVRVRTGSESADGFTAPIFTAMELRVRRLCPNAAQSMLRDRSHEERHAHELEELREASDEAQAGKDRFLACVSHELRTPLNAIIGFAELLANEDLAPRLPAKRQEYADIIRSSGEHLLSVVNSILDVSKLEAGRTELEPESFDLVTLLDQCCDMVGLAAEQGGVELVRARPPAPISLVADKRSCRQIALNLLSNAVKFTPCGGQVALTATQDGDVVVMEIRDTGIGMKQSDLQRIGTPFFQVRGAYNRPFAGTGLGLSVVRGLVGLHGGTIAIESSPGAGTRIVVRLPLNCEAGPSRRSPPNIELLPRSERLSVPPSEKPLARIKQIA